MESCVHEQPDEDPEQWMHKLDQYNMRLATVGGIGVDYSKNNIQMIDHIVNKLPNTHYKHFTTAYGLGSMSGLTLTDFQDKVRSYWKNHVKSD